ncbi:Hypothetical protein R9X50_00691300 [Acrodontium crateriforme]|uniref:Mitochondrial import inner membrane translocase subunit TIM50 n=1 Tax=Acrodontium crateriforme TaxID=150365 RepID=A0AAQ3M9R5_9PEZI|nr:Hypothetical protein R9X50_00691300 [Acrodontium crateriforme]
MVASRDEMESLSKELRDLVLGSKTSQAISLDSETSALEASEKQDYCPTSASKADLPLKDSVNADDGLKQENATKNPRARRRRKPLRSKTESLKPANQEPQAQSAQAQTASTSLSDDVPQSALAWRESRSNTPSRLGPHAANYDSQSSAPSGASIVPSQSPKKANTQNTSLKSQRHKNARNVNFSSTNAMQSPMRASQSPASTPPSTPRPYLQVMRRPIPSPEYLTFAARIPRTTSEPRKLLVVLDLNGTLLYRTNKQSFKSRPKVALFLRYLFANHKVMVWSSATLPNVDVMCEKIFKEEQLDQLVAIWARDKLRLSRDNYKERVQVYKRLSWIWDNALIKQAAQDMGTEWDQDNTVLIDDNLEKAASEPHNLLQIEEFTARPEQMTTDVLGQVVEYLETLARQKDLSAYMRIHPFAYKADAPPYDWTRVLNVRDGA